MSGFLLDTNIISETTRKKPDANFTRWYNAQMLDFLFLPSIALAELWQGLCELDATHAQFKFYQTAIVLIESQYRGRILPFDSETAKIWGSLRGQQRKSGKNLPELDMQIAAIALQHKLTLVTANTRHFAGIGLALLNPKEHK